MQVLPRLNTGTEMKRILATLILAACMPLVLAQNIKPVTARFTKLPVREALTRVFSQLDLDFQVSPDVKGTVSMDASRADFMEVLFEMLSQVDAIYEFQKGKYIIRPIRHQKVSAKGLVNQHVVVPVADYDQADVRLVLRELLGLQGVKYTVTPDVRGTVTLILRNQKLSDVLRCTLAQVDATYVALGGTLEILRKDYDPRSASGIIPPNR